MKIHYEYALVNKCVFKVRLNNLKFVMFWILGGSVIHSLGEFTLKARSPLLLFNDLVVKVFISMKIFTVTNLQNLKSFCHVFMVSFR